MAIEYRHAVAGEAPQLAAMIDIASGGVLQYLFQDLIPGRTPVDIVARNLARGIYPYCCDSVIVAAQDGTPVGMALSYPSSYHGITEEMKRVFPADRLAHLCHFFAARVERSWYLDALCVLPAHEGRGIAAELIARTRQRALDNGYESLSLIAFADNTRAVGLYRHVGFEIVERIELAPNEFIPHETGGFLMYCENMRRQP